MRASWSGAMPQPWSVQHSRRQRPQPSAPASTRPSMTMWPPPGMRLHAVEHEVDEHLLHLVGVEHHLGQVRRQVEGDGHPVLAQLGVHQGHGLAEQGGQGAALQPRRRGRAKSSMDWTSERMRSMPARVSWIRPAASSVSFSRLASSCTLKLMLASGLRISWAMPALSWPSAVTRSMRRIQGLGLLLLGQVADQHHGPEQAAAVVPEQGGGNPQGGGADGDLPVADHAAVADGLVNVRAMASSNTAATGRPTSCARGRANSSSARRFTELTRCARSTVMRLLGELSRMFSRKLRSMRTWP